MRGGRRDEGEHRGDEDPGQLPRVSRAQAAEGVHAASSAAAESAAEAAATAAGAAAESAAAAGAVEAEGGLPEATEHPRGARGEVGDENPGGHSRLPRAKEAAGRSGSGDEDPGRFPRLSDAKVAEAEWPVKPRPSAGLPPGQPFEARRRRGASPRAQEVLVIYARRLRPSYGSDLGATIVAITHTFVELRISDFIPRDNSTIKGHNAYLLLLLW